MAKPTTELKLRKEYKDRGYSVDDKKYICPVCNERFLKLKGKDARQKIFGLWKAFVVCVLVFRKAGIPSVAACPKCGYRKASNGVSNHKVAPTVDTNYCQGKNKNGKPCKNKAMDNGYCGVHQNQAPCYEGQGRATTYLNKAQDNAQVSPGI